LVVASIFLLVVSFDTQGKKLLFKLAKPLETTVSAVSAEGLIGSAIYT